MQLFKVVKLKLNLKNGETKKFEKKQHLKYNAVYSVQDVGYKVVFIEQSVR